jgi:SAM-dependent methyltransferase
MAQQKPIGQQNYEQFADRYAEAVETKPHNAYYERPATLSLIPDVNGRRVLDAGCGPGVYAEWLVRHGAYVVAIDVTPRFVEITRVRLWEQTKDQAEVLVADVAQPLTFAADASFDLVVCPLVLDYVEDWRGAMREFSRILKPGGWMVFSCGHPMGDYFYLQRRGIDIADYFAVQPFETEWNGFGEPKPLIKSFRRSFSEVLNPVMEAGFMLERLLEPLPTEQFKKADPEGYERLLRQPGFLIIRARKP